MRQGQERKAGRIPRGTFGTDELSSSRTDDTERTSTEIERRASAHKLDAALELPERAPRHRVQTLVGMPSVSPEVLEAAREQRNTHPSPPGYDTLLIDLSAAGIGNNPLGAVHTTVPSPPSYETLRAALSSSATQPVRMDSLRATVPVPSGAAKVAAESSPEELHIDVEVVAPAMANVALPAAHRTTQQDATWVNAAQFARAPRLVDLPDSLAPAVVSADEFVLRRRGPSLLPWLLAAAVALLGVFVWSQTQTPESATFAVRDAASTVNAASVAAAQPAVQPKLEVELSAQPAAVSGSARGSLVAVVAAPSSEHVQRGVLNAASVQQTKPRVERDAEPEVRPSKPRGAVLAASDEATVSSERAQPETDGPSMSPAPLPVARPSLELPRRQDVQQAMAAVHSAVAQCVGDKSGHSQITARVAGTGKVTHVLVNGDFAGTRVGSCIARVVRTATLPPFLHDQFEFSYPFAF